MTREVDQLIGELCSADSHFAKSYQSYSGALQRWQAAGLLLNVDIAHRRVLDWECGRGVFSILFSQLGASRTVGIDTWLDTNALPETLRDRCRIQFEKLSLEQFAQQPGSAEGFDLVFANTVTEHMLDLPRLLILCYKLLAPGGTLFLNHDNYYQPVGSHDHGFLYYEGDDIVFLGPRCWETVEKCATSAQFRESIVLRYPWTWDTRTEAQLTPDDCQACPYFRRAQPWAHLLYQANFRDVFPQPCFTTGYPGSSLNKVSPFLLRQFLIEAGFDVEGWIGNKVNNVPPPALLEAPFYFNQADLCTTTIATRCRKGRSASRD